MVDYGPRNIGIDWTQTNDNDFIEFRFGPIGSKATSAYFKAFNPAYNDGWFDSPINYDIRPIDLIRKSENEENRDLVYEIHMSHQEDFKRRKNILQEFVEVSLEVEKMHLAIGIILSEMSEWLHKWSDGDNFAWDDAGDVLDGIIEMVFTSFTEPEGSPFSWPENLPKTEPFTSLLNLIAFIVKLLIGTLGFTIIYAIGIVTHIFQLSIFGRGKNLIADLGLIVEDALSGQFKKMGLMFKSHPNEIESHGFDRAWKISPMDFPSEPFAYSDYEIILGYEKLRDNRIMKGYANPISRDTALENPSNFKELQKNIEIAHLYFVKHHMRPVLAMPNEISPNSQVDMYYWDKSKIYETVKGQFEHQKNTKGFIFELASMTQTRESYNIIRYCPNLIKCDYDERYENLPRGMVFIEEGYIEKEYSLPFNHPSLKPRVSEIAGELKIKEGGFAIKPEGEDSEIWDMSLGEQEKGHIRGMRGNGHIRGGQLPPYAFYPTQLLFTVYGFRPPGFVNWYKNPLRTPLQQRVWPPPPPPKPTKQVHKPKPRLDKRVFVDWNPPRNPEPEPIPEPEPEPEPAPAYGYGGLIRPPARVREVAGWTEQDEAILRERRERQGNENPEE